MGLNTTYIYLFAAIAPFVAMTLLHLRADHYGLWNLIPSLGMVIGAFIAAQLTQHFSALVMIFGGLV